MTTAYVAQDGNTFYVMVPKGLGGYMHTFVWTDEFSRIVRVSDFDMLGAFFARWWFKELMSHVHPDWELDFNSKAFNTT